MKIFALITLSLTLALAACASEPRPTHMSYGPPNAFQSMSPDGGTVHSSDGWGSSTENFHPASPGPFKGY